MYKFTLINTLKSFNLKEIRYFGDFVRSPFFNKNQAAVKLFDYLRKYYPDFNSGKLRKEIAYKEMFGKSDYSESFMKTIIHILSNLADEFLFHLNYRKKPILEKLMICEELNSRKLERRLLKLIRETEAEIEEIKDTHEIRYHYYKYRFYKLRFDYGEWIKFKNKNLIDFVPDLLQQITDSLSFYYFEQLLSGYRSVAAWRDIVPVKFNDELANNIIHYLLNSENDFIKNTNLRIHLFESLLLKEGAVEFFYKLKEVLFSESEKISQDDKFSLMSVLNQYCSKKGTHGVSSFLQERFQIYKQALGKNFYKLKSHLYFDQILFGNIAQTAIILKEFDWVENFINKYGSELPPDNGGIVITYIKARLQFAKSEFKKTLEMLTSIKSIIHIPYKTVIRNLMLMVYYELSYFEQCEYLLASCKKFLVTNKNNFSRDGIKKYENFLKYYSKLLNFKFRGKKDGIENVIVQLQTDIIIVERRWLLEKALAIEKEKTKL